MLNIAKIKGIIKINPVYKRYFFKFIIIIINFIHIFIVILNKFSILKKIAVLKKDEKHIFTFWEPYDTIPGYLKLCVETWKKYIQDYEVIILDYKMAKDFLGESFFSQLICKNMSLPKQADGIRVALLNKYGGIWMDIDTIVINGDFISKLGNHELVLMGYYKPPSQNIGFIYSSKSSIIIENWLKKIIYNVKMYKKLFFKYKKNEKYDKKLWSLAHSWNYLGNGIIDKLVKNSSLKQFYRLDNDKLKVFPENDFFKNTSLNKLQKYQAFYFKKRDEAIVLNNSNSILLLHNSWTPLKYKKMSEKEFLEQEIMISNLLKYLLIK